jgi:hypothetical protein
MLLVTPVGKIQPRHVHPGQNHLAQRFFVLGGRADGAHNLVFRMVSLLAQSHTIILYARIIAEKRAVVVKSRGGEKVKSIRKQLVHVT